MQRGLALVLLASILAAAAAQAHGGSLILEQDVGRYHVVFFAFDFVTDGEEVRVGFNVTDNATREHVALDDPKLEVERWNAAGQVVNRTVEPLEQVQPGLAFVDTTMGPQGKAVYKLPLPQGTARFEQQVCTYNDQGLPVCPSDKKAPDMSAAALLALPAALALARGRRGRREPPAKL